MKINKNLALNKAYYCIILTLCLVLLTPVFVSAMDFDNIVSKPAKTFDNKDYKDIPLLSKYEPIKIENLFGLGKTLTGEIK